MSAGMPLAKEAARSLAMASSSDICDPSSASAAVSCSRASGSSREPPLPMARKARRGLGCGSAATGASIVSGRPVAAPCEGSASADAVSSAGAGVCGRAGGSGSSATSGTAVVALSAIPVGAEITVEGREVGALMKVGASRRAAAVSMPVATIETRMMPSSFSSKVEPKMITESLSISSRMRLAASSTSNSVMSMPPVTLISTARAPAIEMSSRSGLLIAASAAWVARPSPDASPVPIIALPISHITERISAKSRLIWPGLIIRSVTPATPW